MATSATNVLKQFVKTLEVLPKVIVLDIGEGRTYLIACFMFHLPSQTVQCGPSTWTAW